MNNLRQFCLTAVLVLAVAFSAYAGDIECGGFAPPSPPAATGNIECDGLTEIAVSVIQAVLSLS